MNGAKIAPQSSATMRTRATRDAEELAIIFPHNIAWHSAGEPPGSQIALSWIVAEQRACLIYPRGAACALTAET